MKKMNKNIKIGLFLTGIVTMLVVVGIFYTPYDANSINGKEKLLAPCLKHLFGTDNFGRDILSRIMEGSRTTFIVAVATVLIGGSIGTVLGAFTGYFGGALDNILMRINDVLTAFPSILLALVFISLFGNGTYNVIIALGIVFVPSFARLVRGEVIRYKDQDFVKSARIVGASHVRIIFVHILPNALGTMLSSLAIGFNNAVLAEASMSYLGIGVQPPDASLGRMLSESQTYLFSAPWYAIFPGLTIILLVLGVSYISEGLRRK